MKTTNTTKQKDAILAIYEIIAEINEQYDSNYCVINNLVKDHDIVENFNGISLDYFPMYEDYGVISCTWYNDGEAVDLIRFYDAADFKKRIIGEDDDDN
jgi:hypothetical protein